MTEPSQIDTPRLLRIPEVAAYLGVSVSTVERLLVDGAFAGGVVRFRRTTRIRRETLLKFVDACSDKQDALHAPTCVRKTQVPGLDDSHGVSSTVALVRSLRAKQRPSESE